MKQKLIKITDNHYIVVDDTEIKQGDFVCRNFFINQAIRFNHIDNSKSWKDAGWRKITHSTQPLEGGTEIHGIEHRQYIQIKYLHLSEVEEEIYGYSVEKMAEEYEISFTNGEGFPDVDFIAGFRAHQDLTKDKLFTIEDMRKAIEIAQSSSYVDFKLYTDSSQVKHNFSPDNIIKSLLPKTEWDIEFVNGKIKLV